MNADRRGTTAELAGRSPQLRLATWAEDRDESTILFDGFLNQPAQSASALLLLARVARSRFYTPPNMLAAIIANSDPVVTASTDRLRFESFSACCGVAARYDILPTGLDRPPIAHGTTNVDLNPAARAALADVHGLDPLHLKIGQDVTFTTLDRQIVEEKVPLPQRWVRGFAEAQAVSASLQPRAELTAAQARRFVRSLPHSSNGRSALFVAPGREGLRLTITPSRHAVPLGGPSRLRIIEPLLAHCATVTVLGPESTEGPGVSAWQLNLPDARLTITLSPTAMRGFSGEGGLLFHLGSDQAGADAEWLGGLLDDAPLIDINHLTAISGLTANRINTAVAYLAANGLVGYDAAEHAYYHRELPSSRTAIAAMHPRLAAARQLVADGAVTLRDDGADVNSNDTQHAVRGTGRQMTCTCPWYAQHRQSRGPCKHILAAHITQQTKPTHTVSGP